MSNGIRIEKTCEYCGENFVAKTTTTRYCSHRCNSRAYKQRKREEKIAAAKSHSPRSGKPTPTPTEEKAYLTVVEAASLLGFSRRTMYRIVKEGGIPSVKLSQRGTRIRKADLELYMEAEAARQQEERKREMMMSSKYTLSQVRTIYGISDSALYQLLSRHDIPKQSHGKEVLVPKEAIDRLLNPMEHES